MNPDPRDPVDVLAGDYSDCEIDKSKMRYNPWKYIFEHKVKTTGMMKLLWFENDLDTNVRTHMIKLFEI